MGFNHCHSYVFRSECIQGADNPRFYSGKGCVFGEFLYGWVYD
jgi:hypothetical protein